ncbi:MAG TPA: 30S ribosome-binding factor RbfA [Planctomycetota bacterium]|nr:30S ribosome-binding factor RbfA [Planctomycetota bacterium]
MANPRTIARLEARILERAAQALEFEISDPRSGFVTITRVKLSKDLTAARIYYSVLGDEGDKANTARMLQSAGGYLQRLIGRALELRRVPHIEWTYDESIEQAARMEGAIARALERDQRIAVEGRALEEEREEEESSAEGAEETEGAEGS